MTVALDVQRRNGLAGSCENIGNEHDIAVASPGRVHTNLATPIGFDVDFGRRYDQPGQQSPIVAAMTDDALDRTLRAFT